MTFKPDYHGAVVHPSPNFGWTSVGQHGRNDGTQDYGITTIVMHGTSGLMPGCLDWLCQPVARASVHYLVARDGTCYQLVQEANVAWGNGDVEAGNTWHGASDPNLQTISIEHEMPSGNTGTPTDAQQATSIALIADIRRRRGPLPLIRHAAIAPQTRAHCPGDSFPFDAIDKAAQPITPRAFPDVYLQRDPRWAAQLLGGVTGATVGEYGCYLCAFAMLAGYYGHRITPPQMNGALAAQHIYVSGDLMPDDGLHRLYPDLTLEAVYDWSSVPADLGVLKQVASDPALTCVLEVDFDHDPTDGVSSHFSPLAGCDGARVLWWDVWYGDGVDADDMTLHYGPYVARTIQKAVVYRGTMPTPPAVHYELTVAQWLQQTPAPNNAVPNAPDVPAGSAIACIGNPVAVTDKAGNKMHWQRVMWGHEGRAYEGFVPARYVKAV